jgi:beta-N-acetylglucosaminidase
MNYLVLPACEDANFLSALKLAKDIFDIICVLVPIVLILLAAIDLGKIVMGGDTKKTIPMVVKRMISCCAIFFIPILVDLFLEMLGVFSVDSFNVCVNNANTSTIEYYRGKEEEKRILEEKANLLERENVEKERTKLAELREDARKKNEEEAKEAEKNNQTNPGGNYELGEVIEGSATTASQVVWDKTNVSRVSNLTVSQLIAVLNSHGGKAVRYVPYAADLITAENKYKVNVFFLLGVSALESGWINEEHDMISKCNNLGGVCATSNRPSNGCFKNSNCEFAYYSTKGEFINAHASLLGQSYLNPSGSYYEGTTASAVVIHYCPGCSSWPGTVNAIGDQLYAHVSKVM